MLSVFDEDGRFSPRYDDDDVITLEADSCILAIGQRADLSFLKDSDGVALTPGGTIKVDPVTLATSAPGVYAGGDVAFGPRNLIEAVANGKRAARSIHELLAGEGAQIEGHLEVQKLPTRDYRMLAGFEILDREGPPTLDVGRRTGIAEVEIGYGDREASEQAARCLVCHVQTIYDPEKCVLCNRCVDICPEHCLAIVPFEELDLPEDQKRELAERAEANGLPLSAMLKDDDRCIRCGLCAIRCPTDAMTMERFQITERYAPRRDAAPEVNRCRTDASFLMKLGIGAGRGRPRHPGRRLAALARPQRVLRRADHGEAGLPRRVPRRPQVPARPAAVRLPGGERLPRRLRGLHPPRAARCAPRRSRSRRDRGRWRARPCASRTASSARATARGTPATARNVAGPAPRPLAWYHLAVAPDDGQLVVDLAHEVERDFRLTVA